MASAESSCLTMSDAEYRMFCELLRDHCGLRFAVDSRLLVSRRLARRIEELGLGSFRAYHFQLIHGPDGDEELARVIDLLTTNETYFFRERLQLDALIEEIIPGLLAERRERGSRLPVSIWSAGCSSGEEPYSVVALAIEAGFAPGADLRVYASDISRAMMAKSRCGRYRESAFRDTADHLFEKYFFERDGYYYVEDAVKRHVDFIHLNLLDDDKIALLSSMDVIMCRNVLIYFDSDARKRVIRTFYDKLRPGGHLLLGHSESLINLSSAFELCHLKNDLVYRRPPESCERWDASEDAR